MFKRINEHFCDSVQTGEVTYRVKQPDSFAQLTEILTGILDDVNVIYPNSADFMHVILTGDKKWFSTGFTRNMNTDTVMDSLKHIQSGSSFLVERVIVKFVRELTGGCSTSHHSGSPNAEWYQRHRQTVRRITADDQLCAARSLLILKSHVEQKEQRISKAQAQSFRDSRNRFLTEAALKLCEDAKVDTSKPATYDDLQRFATHLNAVICVVSYVSKRVVWHSQLGAKQYYYLLATRNHYEPIKKMHRLVGAVRYCNDCFKGYRNDNYHHCPSKCSCCFQRSCSSWKKQQAIPKSERSWLPCSQCNRAFPNQTCFDNHVAFNVCARFKKCAKCNKRLDREDHKCSYSICPGCKQYTSRKHQREQCFVSRVPLQPPSEKYLFADIECNIHTDEHIPHLIISRDFHNNKTEHTTAESFVRWLLKEKKGHTVIFHNGSGYDLPILYRTIVTHSSAKCVKPIYSGAKLIYISIGKGSTKIRFIDSLNFLGVALSKLPAMLGLETKLKKGYFPHWFDDVKYEGPVPDVKFFKPDEMDTEKRKDFLEWHHSYTSTWNYQQQLRDYCDNDVQILREACLKFRQILLDVTGCDPFQYCTIASCAMAIYRAKFMKEESIPNLPPFVTRIIRDCLYGGRTETHRLHWEQKDKDEQTVEHDTIMTDQNEQKQEEKPVGKYIDVNSLYPFVMLSCPYPLGHPKLFGLAFNLTKGTQGNRLMKQSKASGKESWELLGDVRKYLKPGTLAIIQCDVECPSKLLHPILPSRRDGKLVFDLLPKRKEWFASPELITALEHGYKVTKVWNVALWEKTTTDQFAGYVQAFLKLKDEVCSVCLLCVCVCLCLCLGLCVSVSVCVCECVFVFARVFSVCHALVLLAA